MQTTAENGAFVAPIGIKIENLPSETERWESIEGWGGNARLGEGLARRVAKMV
jgi:hypothetical protein